MLRETPKTGLLWLEYVKIPSTCINSIAFWLGCAYLLLGSALLMAADTLAIYNAYYEPLVAASYFAAGVSHIVVGLLLDFCFAGCCLRDVVLWLFV